MDTNSNDTNADHDHVGTAEELLTLQYDHLRALAARWFAEQALSHTLQPTALVHEAYLKIVQQGTGRWRSRTHFFALAATAMRQVLIDHARRRRAGKRGGHWGRVTLAETPDRTRGDVDPAVLGEALERLAALNPRQCRIVELRFLAGLSVEETAEVIGVSTRTVKLDWRMARAWLLGELGLR